MNKTLLETKHLIIELDTYEIGFEFVIRYGCGIRIRLLVLEICIGG